MYKGHLSIYIYKYKGCQRFFFYTENSHAFCLIHLLGIHVVLFTRPDVIQRVPVLRKTFFFFFWLRASLLPSSSDHIILNIRFFFFFFFSTICHDRRYNGFPSGFFYFFFFFFILHLSFGTCVTAMIIILVLWENKKRSVKLKKRNRVGFIIFHFIKFLFFLIFVLSKVKLALRLVTIPGRIPPSQHKIIN